MEGLIGVSLLKANLTQWVFYIQDVAVGMRKPPQKAVDCPTKDITGILHKLEKMSNIQFCWFCYALGSNCDCCQVVPQASTSLWNPPGHSYAAMMAATTLTASTSMGGVPTAVEPLPGFLALPTVPLPMMTNLLAEAGVGRGKALQNLQASARQAGGPCQVQPQSAQQSAQQLAQSAAPQQ